MDNRVDIIVPVYNELENFRSFYDFIVANVHLDWNVLIVYDFPEDTTLEAAKPIAEKDSRVRLILNPARGALNALKIGFKNTKAEAILTAMIDDPPEVLAKIDEMTELFYRENADVIAASRYMPGGSHAGGPLIKGLLSRLAGLSLYWLIRLPIHDATYNTRIYRKSFIDSIKIESARGFEVALELTIKAHLAGKKLMEVPVKWHERTIGQSRFKILKWLPAYLHWYWYGIKNYYFSNRSKNSLKD